MPAVQDIDGAVVRAWLRLAADELSRERAAIDVLNVFPVADADTGTNMHRTIACAASALAGLPDEASAAEIWQAAATAALQGACGNSGIILSQLLCGLADTCGPASPCDGQVVALALTRAAALARAAVHRPVEGTVLTVADAAARAAAQTAAGQGRLPDVGGAAARAAREALLGTRQQLRVLAASGVVDAGGAGLCVLLDALDAAISGRTLGSFPLPEPLHRPAVSTGSQDAPFCYEVTYLLDATREAVANLRDRLDQLGDSLVVSGRAPLWHVHVHVTEAGAAVEAGISAGRLSKITVSYLNETQHPITPARPAAALPVVAVAEGAGGAGGTGGAGLADLLRAAGATVVTGAPAADTPGADMPAADTPAAAAADTPAADMLAALDEVVATSAVATLLTVDGGLARRWPAGWPVLLAGCETQLLAAMAVHASGRDLDADLDAMGRAIAGMRCGRVSRREPGEEDPRSPGGTGPYVGMIDGDIALAGRDEAGVALAVTDLLLGTDTEMLTLVSGRDAAPGLAGQVANHVAGRAPGVEVVCYDGGMSGSLLLIGAE